MTKPSTPVNDWIIFSLVAVGIFMSTLDGSIVNIAMPTIMKDLNAPLSVIEWVALIYLLTVTSLLLSFPKSPKSACYECHFIDCFMKMLKNALPQSGKLIKGRK